MRRPIIWYGCHPQTMTSGSGAELRAEEIYTDRTQPIIDALRAIFNEIQPGIPVVFALERGGTSLFPSTLGIDAEVARALEAKSWLSARSWLDLFRFRPEEVAQDPLFLQLHRYTLQKENEHGKRNELKTLEGTLGSLLPAIHSLLTEESTRRPIRLFAEEPDALCWAYSLAEDSWLLYAKQLFEAERLEECIVALGTGLKYRRLAAQSRDKLFGSELAPICKEVPEVQVVGFRGSSHREHLHAELLAHGIEVDSRGDLEFPNQWTIPKDVYVAAGCPAPQSEEGRRLLLLDLIWILNRAGENLSFPKALFALNAEQVEGWMKSIGRTWRIGQPNARTRQWLRQMLLA